jgi:hypothetical protein
MDPCSLNHTGAGADDLAHATKAAGGASGQALVGAAVSNKGGNAGGQALLAVFGRKAGH